MRPTFSLLLVAVFAVGGLGGCLSADPANTNPPTGPARPALDAKGQLLAVLDAIPAAPTLDRLALVNRWESFVLANTPRHYALPHNTLAANFLQAELEKAGYKSEVLTVKNFPLVGSAAPVQTDFKVVRGIKLGTDHPDHRIALISHYDVQAATTMGAYDDGSGTMLELEICKLLAKVPTNKTIECVFFDGEETGLSGSSAYMEAYKADTKRDYVYDQGFGYDMTGLNWPGYAPWRFYAFVGTHQHTSFDPDLAKQHMAFLNVTFYEWLGAKVGLPIDTKGVWVNEKNHRNSDERHFERQGIPIVRFAGGFRPGYYPQYHLPADTPQYVYAFACGNCTDQAKGKEILAKGMEMVVLASYYTILAFDRYDPKLVDMDAFDPHAGKDMGRP